MMWSGTSNGTDTDTDTNGAVIGETGHDVWLSAGRNRPTGVGVACVTILAHSAA